MEDKSSITHSNQHRPEYMQLRAIVCHNAYHVATSTNQLILFILCKIQIQIDESCHQICLACPHW